MRSMEELYLDQRPNPATSTSRSSNVKRIGAGSREVEQRPEIDYAISGV
jgi:hypothetical protein